MVEHATSVPQPGPGPQPAAALPEATTATPAADAGAAPAVQPALGTGHRPTCQHCRQPLFEDSLWGWMHAGGRYLCQDAATGEPLCQPATPA
ncbi:hypothetical protein GCE86_10560 [Micromonospora terminaliae]|uniref:Uncharacterized protein n=1 Tax=Micromonospora terminaliae TaxID=1914461 RepID=A0AAJ2ZDN5_9ACTN|nr:hypothetical protein [Micromonospora terminaliae]NES27786.1 hypothetical protein [Micromonospora terminaliae]QGL47431.1 hypothetical protein GCE86_10560 [Micromonospora terminaliae]